MKRALLLLAVLLMFVNNLNAGAIANIIASDGLSFTIDWGTADGIQVGMKGEVKAVSRNASGESNITLGRFVVRSVLDNSALVKLEKLEGGARLEDARFVVFDAYPELNSSPAQQTSSKDSVDSLLEKGDKAFESGKFEQALQYYQNALALDPHNVVAKEKCIETQRKIDELKKPEKFKYYINKSDASYAKGDVKYAFLYLVEAYRAYPQGATEVKVRLEKLNQEHATEIQDIMAARAEELRDVSPAFHDMLAPPPPPESPTKAEGAPEAVPTAATVSTTANDQQMIEFVRSRAAQVSKNEYGYWEALLPKNIVMVYIPAGDFTVGSPATDGAADEHPSHKVFIDGFWLGKTEVTFDQYDWFCSETGRARPADEGWGRGNQPVIHVSWDDAAAFCGWLSTQTGFHFRLPTEAEWEKAARSTYPWGETPASDKMANYNNHVNATTPIGSYQKGISSYGIYDMAGNVWEWIADWYDSDYYGISEARNPRGPASGDQRVVRGGCWADKADFIRSANRSSESPSSKMNIIGLRLAMDALAEAGTPAPIQTVPTVTLPKPEKSPISETSEPFLEKVRDKAEKIEKNRMGFWEAFFPKDLVVIYVPPGEFTLGSPVGEGDADEHPSHKVFIDGFWLGKTEVTFDQYDWFCSETGRERPSDEGWGRGRLPVINVTYHDADEFCTWLAAKTNLPFRLPTEAEWEKGARDLYPWGDAAPNNRLANFNRSLSGTVAVGAFPAGASFCGALDMAGNVWEWVSDWYDEDYYRNSESHNPRGPASGSERVVRGGSWADSRALIRSANRSSENPSRFLNILGFRLALSGQ